MARGTVVSDDRKVLGYFCEAGKKGDHSSLVGRINKSCHMLHACSNIKLVTAR